ncbi:MAG: acyltransferase family protein [Ruminococcus sp.]
MADTVSLRKRNHTLDIFKAFAAFFVVFIHSQFPGTFGSVVSSVAQSGVLLFFMISGYYIYNADSKKIIKSIKHILFLIVITYVLNIIRIIIQTDFNPYNQFVELFTVKHIMQYFVLNISLISGVMWFMLALLYCYLIYLILNHFKLTKILYIATPILLIINLFIGDIFVHLGITNFSGFVRNFLITGIPFFTLGNYIHHKLQKIEKAPYFKNKYLLLVALFGFVLSVAEALLTKEIQYSIGNFVFIITIFLTALYNPYVQNKALEFIGSKCCFWIYILHPIIIHIWKYITFSVYDNYIFQWITPLCILTMTVLTAVIIELIKKKVKSNGKRIN